MASSDWSIIFSQPIDSVRLVAPYIYPLYQQHPVEFSTKLLESVPTIPPKTFRLVCYQLFSNNVTLKDVLDHLPTPPSFLFHCEQVPSENMTTLLKYKFPPTLRLSPEDAEESLFFWKSYRKSVTQLLQSTFEFPQALTVSINLDENSENVSEEENSHPLNLEWLYWIYDLFRTQKLDLNFPNFGGLDSTGQSIRRTLLEEAVFRGSLTHTLDLLKYSVSPQDLSDRLILDIADSPNLLISGLILRQLVRYGSQPIVQSEPQLREMFRELFSNQLSPESIEQLSISLFRFIFSGSQLSPLYADSKFSSRLDEDDDFLIATRISPEIIDSVTFAEIYPQLNREKFKQKVEQQNAETRVVQGKIQAWPKYMDKTVRGTSFSFCPTENEDLRVENPPGPIESYRKVLSYLPNTSTH